MAMQDVPLLQLDYAEAMSCWQATDAMFEDIDACMLMELGNLDSCNYISEEQGQEQSHLDAVVPSFHVSNSNFESDSAYPWPEANSSEDFLYQYGHIDPQTNACDPQLSYCQRDNAPSTVAATIVPQHQAANDLCSYYLAAPPSSQADSFGTDYMSSNTDPEQYMTIKQETSQTERSPRSREDYTVPEIRGSGRVDSFESDTCTTVPQMCNYSSAQAQVAALAPQRIKNERYTPKADLATSCPLPPSAPRAPMNPPCLVTPPRVISEARKESLRRYRDKKTRRMFAKKVRYHLRKINAVKRPRVKGRFVKKDENVGVFDGDN